MHNHLLASNSNKCGQRFQKGPAAAWAPGLMCCPCSSWAWGTSTGVSLTCKALLLGSFYLIWQTFLPPTASEAARQEGLRISGSQEDNTPKAWGRQLSRPTLATEQGPGTRASDRQRQLLPATALPGYTDSLQGPFSLYHWERVSPSASHPGTSHPKGWWVRDPCTGGAAASH